LWGFFIQFLASVAKGQKFWLKNSKRPAIRYDVTEFETDFQKGSKKEAKLLR
jgi:hypothetical protein